MGSTKDLTEGEPARQILFFTLPLIAGNIFQQLYAFVDTLIVGRFLGVEALAAVGCTGPLFFLIVGFMNGTTSGFSICTGQYFGAKDAKRMRQSAVACIILSVSIALFISLISVFFCRDILIAMQTPPEIIEGAYSFIVIVFGGLIISFALMMTTNIVRALGDSRMPTVILALSLALNIIIEPIFIVVFDWGIAGAAWGILVAQGIGVTLAFFYIYKKVPVLHICLEDWHVTRAFLWEHIRIGVPMGFQLSVIAIGAIVVQIALNNLGAIAVAAYSAAQKVDAIATMPMLSFAVAIATYTAQNYGACKFERIWEGVRKCVYMSVGFSIVVGCFNHIFGSELVQLFVGEGETQVIAYGHMYLTIQSCCYWLFALLMIFRHTLQALGRTIVPVMASVVELIMRVLAAIVLARMWGFFGVCWATPLAWLGGTVPLVIAYFYIHYRLMHDSIGDK